MYQNTYDPRNYDPRMFYDQYGQNYNPRPAPKFTQPLTNEQIAKLRQGESAIDWRISQMDLLRASCTHKEANGANALIKQGNGLWHCTICGADFSMDPVSEKEVQDAVNVIINLLQMSKAMYLDAPASFISNYYQIIPILEKFPTVFRLAWNNFNMHEDYNSDNVQGVYGGFGGSNDFQRLNNIIAYNPVPQPSPFIYQQPEVIQPNPYPYPGYASQPYGYPGYPPQPQGVPIATPPAPPTQYYDQNYMNQVYGGANPFVYGTGVPMGGAPAPGVIPHPVPQAQQQNKQTTAQQNPDQGNNKSNNNGEVVQQKTFKI